MRPVTTRGAILTIGSGPAAAWSSDGAATVSAGAALALWRIATIPAIAAAIFIPKVVKARKYKRYTTV